MLKLVAKRVRAMYDEYSEVEMITKDIEDINQEMELLRTGQSDLLKDF